MNFLSIEWLSVLVGTVSIYWLAPQRHRQLLVTLITMVFLAVFSLESVIILSVFAGTTYWLTRGESVSGRCTIIALAIVFVVLAWFKVRFFNAGGKAGDVIANVAIPLGLSYYSFRCFHFVFERYRGTIEQPHFKDYINYLFFLPTIVVGPINRFQEYVDEVSNVTWSSVKLSQGLERILFGYFKIAVLGNLICSTYFGDWIASIDSSNEALITYLGIIQDGLLLYFLFSGFSDVAIGFGLLLGIKVLENFNWPYIQKNIADFWRSWHMSLSGWCRDYVYLPVLGATRNPYLATLASFTTIGLWHEISLRYIVWGLYHGVGVLIWRKFQSIKRKHKPSWCDHKPVSLLLGFLSILFTLHFVFFGLVIVNQPDFSSVLGVYRKVLIFW